MNKEELKKEYLHRDRVTKALSKGGKIRAAVIKNTKVAQDAQKKHKLDFVSAALLARLMAGASLVSSFFKGEERVILEMEGNGPISKLYSESLKVGETRGFVEHRSEIEPDGITSFRDAIGIGLLRVTKVVYNKKEPTVGIVPIQKGDVASDLVAYFLQSEQIPTALLLDVKLGENGEIIQSGGLIVQALPGADESILERITKCLEEGISIAEMIDSEKTTNDILDDILGEDFKITGTTQTDFFCRCSLDTFKNKLLLLGVAEIKDMQKKNQNELACKYCNEHYYLSDVDFEELITTAQASVN